MTRDQHRILPNPLCSFVHKHYIDNTLLGVRNKRSRQELPNRELAIKVKHEFDESDDIYMVDYE